MKELLAPVSKAEAASREAIEVARLLQANAEAVEHVVDTVANDEAQVAATRAEQKRVYAERLQAEADMAKAQERIAKLTQELEDSMPEWALARWGRVNVIAENVLQSKTSISSGLQELEDIMMQQRHTQEKLQEISSDANLTCHDTISSDANLSNCREQLESEKATLVAKRRAAEMIENLELHKMECQLVHAMLRRASSSMAATGYKEVAMQLDLTRSALSEDIDRSEAGEAQLALQSIVEDLAFRAKPELGQIVQDVIQAIDMAMAETFADARKQLLKAVMALLRLEELIAPFPELKEAGGVLAGMINGIGMDSYTGKDVHCTPVP